MIRRDGIGMDERFEWSMLAKSSFVDFSTVFIVMLKHAISSDEATVFEECVEEDCVANVDVKQHGRKPPPIPRVPLAGPWEA